MSVTNKEKNFISAVVYLHNDGAQAVRFFKELNAVLDQHFEQFELVAVNDACTDDTIPTLRDWAKALEKPLTILHLSLHQGRETAMNAGLDAAIGDYVYEFDSTQTPYPIELVFAKLKGLLRSTQARTQETLWSAIGSLLDRFTPEECRGYIRHCGYYQSG